MMLDSSDSSESSDTTKPLTKAKTPGPTCLLPGILSPEGTLLERSRGHRQNAEAVRWRVSGKRLIPGP